MTVWWDFLSSMKCDDQVMPIGPRLSVYFTFSSFVARCRLVGCTSISLKPRNLLSDRQIKYN